MSKSTIWLRMLAALCALALLSSCSNGTTAEEATVEQDNATVQQTSTTSRQAKLVDCSLIEDKDLGGAYLDISIEDFNTLGFAFGDGIDVTFSNGFSLKDIPYFNGYYVKTGEPLACGYPGYEYVALKYAQGPSLWEQVGLHEGDTATVLLTGPEKYLDVQDALSLSYSSERSDFPDDVTFANYRELSGGTLQKGLLYRSASPVDDIYNRAGYVNALLKDTDVQFVLDLADSRDEIDTYAAEDDEKGTDVSYFLELDDKGNVAPLGLDASYMSSAFTTKLTQGLRQLAAHEGPYLIHCLEGKDRTGFVCMLLEALAGATYDQMCDDYMVTYANYYGVTKESDSERYDTIVSIKFDDMLESFTQAKDDDDLKTMDYVEAARTYLRNGGMTDEEIDHLTDVICR